MRPVRVDFKTLGAVDLRNADGQTLSSVLHQPKRTALLAYLAIRGKEYQSRDTLIALFWPESTETSGRHSLSQAIYKLRDAVGADVITTRGDVAVGIALDLVYCDALAFAKAISDGLFAEALDLYKGDFLAGFLVDGLDEFERWVATIRTDLRSKAATAAWSLASQQLARHSVAEAVRTATRALELSPESENRARALLKLLISSDEKAGAMAFYTQIKRVLRDALDASPSRETVALVEPLRPLQALAPMVVATDSTELSSRGLPPTTSVAPSAIQHRHRSFRRIAAVALAAVLAVTAIGWIVRDFQRTPPHVTSIAVLPFENLARDTSEDYFAEGMYDAVIGELGEVSALRVTPRASTGRYRSISSPAQVMKDLNVDAVLSGGVIRDPDSVKVVVHLYGGEPQKELWSSSYKRALRDVLSIHADIARAVASEVEARVNARDARRTSIARTVNPAAYDALLQGAYHARHRSGADLTGCFRFARSAVATDPTYAPAYELLAECYNVSTFVNSSAPAEMFEGAKRAARRAIALDPDLAPAYSALAYAQAHYDWDWAGAERSYRRALQLNPSLETAEEDLAWLLSWSGRFDEALQHARRAQQLDPFSPQATLRVAMIDNFAGRYDDAIGESRQAIALDSTYMFAYDRLHWAYYSKRQPALALDAARRASELSGPGDIRRRAFLAHAFAYNGQRQQAERILSELLDLQGQVYLSPGSVALVYVALGQHKEALNWLERAFEGRDGDMVLLKVFGVWDPLRNEPRFKAILARMRFPS